MIFIFIESCVDKGLENVGSKSEMITNGWAICMDNGDSCSNNLRYEANCNAIGYWGYRYGCPIGSVCAQFEGSGKATLSFGSCHMKVDANGNSNGATYVYLNGMMLKSAWSSQSHGLVVTEEVTFSFKRGDVLKIVEWGQSIVMINSLKITECTGIFDLHLLVLTKIVKISHSSETG